MGESPEYPNEPPSDTRTTSHHLNSEKTKMQSDMKMKAILRALNVSIKAGHGFKNGTCDLLEFNRWEDLTGSCTRTIDFLESDLVDCRDSGLITFVEGMTDQFSIIKAFIRQLLKMNSQSPRTLLPVAELGNILELYTFVSEA